MSHGLKGALIHQYSHQIPTGVGFKRIKRLEAFRLHNAYIFDIKGVGRQCEFSRATSAPPLSGLMLKVGLSRLVPIFAVTESMRPERVHLVGRPVTVSNIPAATIPLDRQTAHVCIEQMDNSLANGPQVVKSPMPDCVSSEID